MSDEIAQAPVVERTEPLEDPAAPAVGKWYWFTDKDGTHLGCVVHVGSNYAKLEGPQAIGSDDDGEWSVRVHLDGFEKSCRYEPNAQRVIDEKISSHQREAVRLMGKVQEVTEQLAISMGPRALQAQTEVQALALRGTGEEIPKYKKALVKAKDKTLPELFKQIEHENETMAKWMKASLIPMAAAIHPLKKSIGAIEDRIFNVELYAGLCESVVKVKDGKPAAMAEPIHLFQRRLYMDEECLLDYAHGGMEFKDINKFDAWLLKPANLARLLPRPRCAVAFQVRRNEKHRTFEGFEHFIRFILSGYKDTDKWTFLYLRNGEQVFRLATEIRFGEQLFPDIEHQNLVSGQLYAKHHGEHLISQAAYEQMVKTEAEQKAAAEAKIKKDKVEFPAKMRAYRVALKEHKRAKRIYDKEHTKLWNAYRDTSGGSYERRKVRKALRQHEKTKPHEPSKPYLSSFGPHVSENAYQYTPWNRDNVYYDDIAVAVKREMQRHNRLVLVLQGILDRSLVMAPHPAWQLWTEKGFMSALRLVYDDSRALAPSEHPPDFDAYRKRLNESITAGSVTLGQDPFWLAREAERHDADERRRGGRNSYERQWYRPYGNPGPGKFARVMKLTQRGCLFRWTRERNGRLSYADRHYRGKSYDDKLPCSIYVPVEHLFNVDAYKPGDFRQFFEDPRTREDYLQWAPLLLEAEEFHAGNRKIDGAADEDGTSKIAEAPEPADESETDAGDDDPEDDDTGDEE